METVRALAEHGADVNATDVRCTSAPLPLRQRRATPAPPSGLRLPRRTATTQIAQVGQCAGVRRALPAVRALTSAPPVHACASA